MNENQKAWQIAMQRFDEYLRKRSRKGKYEYAYLLDDPKLCEYFEAFCMEGYSPRYFSSRMKGRMPAFYKAVKKNPEFRRINAEYSIKQEDRNIGFYSYLKPTAKK